MVAVRSRDRDNGKHVTRIHHHLLILPASIDDTAEYVRFRPAAAGTDRALVPDDALAALHGIRCRRCGRSTGSRRPYARPPVARRSSSIATSSHAPPRRACALTGRAGPRRRHARPRRHEGRQPGHAHTLRCASYRAHRALRGDGRRGEIATDAEGGGHRSRDRTALELSFHDAPSEPPPPAADLTVDDLAQLFGVSTGTIRNWTDDGLLTPHRQGSTIRFAAAEIRRAKVLRDDMLLDLSDVKNAKIDATNLAQAILESVVRPTKGADRRFSLRDAKRLVKWKRGEWDRDVDDEQHTPTLENAATPTAGVAPTPAKDISQLQSALAPEIVVLANREGLWDAVLEYVRDHQDPAKLPTTFWESPSCPLFIPPVGIHRYIYRNTFTHPRIGVCTWIRRSEGFSINNDGWLFSEPEDDECLFDKGAHRCGTAPPRCGEANLQYQQLLRAWEDCWRRVRHARLIAEGKEPITYADEETAEPRDRIFWLRRYHDENLYPQDLPDWFFCSDDPPEHIPPTGWFRYTYGAPYADMYGRWSTPIIRSAGWDRPPGGVPYPVPAEVVTFDWGAFLEGTTPARFATANREFDLLERDWDDECSIRRRRRGL